MSACGVLVQNTSKELPLKVPKSEDESVEVDENATEDQQTGDTAGASVIEKNKKKRITYTKEELLELRSAPASLRKPDFISEEFFKDGVWKIEDWHKSSASTCASPTVDGKCATFDSGKKIELLDSTIELAPHRRSFCQGCHVQSTTEADSREKEGPLKRLGGKANLTNDKAPFYEGRDRLTGRAALRRRNLEKAVLRENRCEPDGKRLSKGNYDDDIDQELRNINDRNGRGRGFDKENRIDNKKFNKNDKEGQRRADAYETLPEWMTDGPSSQLETIELKGFNKEIEDERSAMRNESKQRPVDRQPVQRTRKSSKGSSRSSTPNDKRQLAIGKIEAKEREEESKGNDQKKQGLRQGSLTAEGTFDDNSYFDVMDYLPPHLFADDYTNETSSQSKFSQWFQSRSGSSNDGSRPNSVPLSFEATHLQGFPAQSPTVPLQQYFTPIQPAPATHQYENPIAVSPLMELFPNRKSPTAEKSKEVKGRLTLKDIEPDVPKPIGQKPDKPVPPDDNDRKIDLTAFDKLVSSMKAAGQLPEKPAPVVSGLPEHLLPRPPKRTSPSFEKLKKALSRSPSPVTAGRMSPLNFINRPVSPLVAPMPDRLSSPDIFPQQLHQRSISPGSFFGNFQDSFGRKKGAPRPNPLHQQQVEARNSVISNQNRRSSMNNGGMITPEGNRNQKQQGSARIPAAFLPTSVIKKMHTEKQEGKERPDTFGDSLAAKLDLTSAHQNQLEALSAQRDGRKDALQEHGFRSNTDNSRDDVSSQRLLDDLLNGNVKNMDLSGNRDLLAQRLNSSKAGDLDSGGRVGRSYHSSGPLRRDFSPSSSSNMAVGSSTLFTRSQSDMEARQKNLLDDKNVAAGLQQQMSSNRPDVFSDVNRSGKSSYENRPSGIDIKARGHATGMQARGPIHQLPNGHQYQMQNQANISRGQVPTRPAPPQAPMRQFSHGRNTQQNNARLQMPMSKPAPMNNIPFHRPNFPADNAAMLSQIMQRSALIQQVALAHFPAAPMIQQHQQQNLFRNPMQAAMVYAKLQAAEAMMYNPRAVANNLQAVAQQMGLRAPQPGQGMPKPVPTPLLNPPVDKGPAKLPEEKAMEEPSQQTASPLSKWFNVNAIKKTPPAPSEDPVAKGKIISVEDLERSQK